MSDQSECPDETLPPFRLRYLFSRRKRRCVILRRGPTDWVRLILWDMVKDEFLPGQWLNGPIRDFDLSPNGDHLLYFVSYHKTRASYLWAAISKPPYFTALAMWPISDAWGGCCTFVDDSRIYIEKGGNQAGLELSAGYSLKRYTLVSEKHDWDWKMKRNGWAPHVPDNHPADYRMFHLVWRKKLIQKGVTLCLQHRVRCGNSETVYWLDGVEGKIAHPKVDCADFDPYGRLIVALSGMLYVVRVGENDKLVWERIADFNAHVPETIQAPDHAKRW